MIALIALIALIAAAPPPALAVSWGNAPRQLGLIREAESSPEAPGSLAVDGDGRIYVLDAVHLRVAVYGKDGALDASVRLPSDTVEDIALLQNGDLVALDRLVDRTVTVVAPNGAVVARAPVEGAGVPDGGEVTAVFADATGVWLEVLHGEQVRVLDGAGRVDVARATRPGVPMAVNGAPLFVRLRKVHDDAQVLFFDAAGRVVGDGAIAFHDLLELSGLVVQGDRVFVAGHELVQRDPVGKPQRDVVVVAELRVRAGDVVGVVETGKRHEVKASPEWVPLKQLVAAPGGRVAHLYVDSTARAGANAVEVTSW